MPRARTIACPKCATRLRVRSLDAVSDSDTCPECGTPLKPTATQQSADLQAAEAEPLHPALAETGNESRRPAPAAIAAAVTGLLALVVIVPLLLGSPESKPDEGVLSINAKAEPDASPATSGSGPTTTIPVVAKDEQPDSPKPEVVATAEGPDHPEIATSDPNVPEKPNVSTKTDPETATPDISTVPNGVEVAVGSESPTEKKQIQQTSVGSEEPAKPPANTANPQAPAIAKQPATPPPAIEERLDVPIAKFELKKLTTLKAVLESVEVMAELRIEFSPDIPEAVSDREIVFSLEGTSPRGILNEAAKRAGLTMSIDGDRVTLKPTDR